MGTTGTYKGCSISKEESIIPLLCVYIYRFLLDVVRAGGCYVPSSGLDRSKVHHQLLVRWREHACPPGLSSAGSASQLNCLIVAPVGSKTHDGFIVLAAQVEGSTNVHQRGMASSLGRSCTPMHGEAWESAGMQ